MHQDTIWPSDKTELYSLLVAQLGGLLEGCPPVSALANAAALLWDAMESINWAGFYLLKDDSLYLGPFQGKTACTIIKVGRGVCGTAAETREIQLVPDVHAFPGHIACDSASKSEIVLPLIKENELLGVMDIDSPIKDRFDEIDAEGLKALCNILTDKLKWDSLL